MGKNKTTKQYADSLNEVKTTFMAALDKFVTDGKKIIADILADNGLDGDVMLVKNGTRGTLEISEWKRPLNGDFYIAFYPYKKDGSKYASCTERFTIIPNEEGTIKVFLEAVAKAPDVKA